MGAKQSTPHRPHSTDPYDNTEPEECHKKACQIQRCLEKNRGDSKRCQDQIAAYDRCIKTWEAQMAAAATPGSTSSGAPPPAHSS